jgi:ketosteroid isomerase-like protein
MDGPEVVIERLVRATNDHDVNAVAACFAPNYANETPAHPARGFRGREQVRRNWEQIFANVRDIRAEVLQLTVDGDTVWTEWEMVGTRRDGSPHRMRGVILFTVRDDTVQTARFYLEPVDDGPGTVDDALREQIVRT